MSFVENKTQGKHLRDFGKFVLDTDLKYSSPDFLKKITPLPKDKFPDDAFVEKLMDPAHHAHSYGQNPYDISPEFDDYLRKILPPEDFKEKKYSEYLHLKGRIISAVHELRYPGVPSLEGRIPYPGRDFLTIGDIRQIVQSGLHIRLAGMEEPINRLIVERIFG